MQRVDVVVIGGGIAGVSVAAHLAEHADVVLLEAESTLAYHTTGRSAALFFGSYGHKAIVPLSQASLDWFNNPPTDHPVLSPRGALIVELNDNRATVTADLVDADRVIELCPALDRNRVRRAAWEAGAADMDVAAIHQAYVRAFRNNGGVIVQSARAESIERKPGSGWVVSTPQGEFAAQKIVNAAGAWGDVVAGMAGVQPVGLVPKRRTVFMVTAPPDSQDWPLVTDADMTFYFKPDGVQLLCSLADETPSEPCDSRPVDVDIALAIERINDVTDLGIRSVRSSWAGLRTFALDGGMVIGEDAVEGFFWLVGQGGTGIQTAPAAARLAAGVVLDGETPDDLAALGMSASDYSPDRFRTD